MHASLFKKQWLTPLHILGADLQSTARIKNIIECPKAQIILKGNIHIYYVLLKFWFDGCDAASSNSNPIWSGVITMIVLDYL
jgi:hypothetical protein